MAESKALRLIVHRLTSGEIAASLLQRTWRGAEAWDRRLSPPMRLGTPPPAPPFVPAPLWVVLCAVANLLGPGVEVHVSRVSASAPPGGSRGESAVWPIVRGHDRE